MRSRLSYLHPVQGLAQPTRAVSKCWGSGWFSRGKTEAIHRERRSGVSTRCTTLFK